MAKLSHIEDIERRREQETARELEQAARREPEFDKKVAAAQGAAPAKKTAADFEEDFHGIDAGAPMGIGQKFLIFLAVLVTLAALLYIVNSWLHFI